MKETARMLPRGTDPIRARSLTGFASLVGSHGRDAMDLAESVGVSGLMLETPDRTLALNGVATLLEHSARALMLPNFGLLLSDQQDIHVLGPIALIGLNSATIGESLQGVARYLPHYSPAASLEMVMDVGHGRARLHYGLRIESTDGRRQAIELAYALIVKSLQEAAPQDPGGWEIHFAHPQGADTACYARHFKCRTLFGQQRDAIIFPSNYLARCVKSACASVLLSTRQALDRAMRKHPLDIALRVQCAVQRQLARAPIGIKSIATQIGLDTRTFQRRLADVQVNFEDIVDEVRRSVADALLSDRNIELVQVASMLGYSEQSSLNRACLRWFSNTPAIERKRRLQAGQTVV